MARKSRGWATAVIGSSLAGLGAWGAHRLLPMRDARVGSVAPGLPPGPAPIPVMESLELSRPQETERKVAESGAVAIPDPDALLKYIEAARQHAGDPVAIAMKYAGLERSQILDAYDRLWPVYRAEANRLIAERWRMGLFETTFVVGDEKVPTPRRDDGTIPTFGFESRPVEGGAIVKTTVLGAEEYPDFTALSREAHWLRGHIGPGAR